METYLFLPRVLGVNRKSTPAHVFYRELENQARLVLRQVTLNHLASDGCSATELLRGAIDMLVYPSRFSDHYRGFSVEGISNILRCDCLSCTRHMEDAKRIVYVPTDQSYSKTKGRRLTLD